MHCVGGPRKQGPGGGSPGSPVGWSAGLSTLSGNSSWLVDRKIQLTLVELNLSFNELIFIKRYLIKSYLAWFFMYMHCNFGMLLSFIAKHLTQMCKLTDHNTGNF